MKILKLMSLPNFSLFNTEAKYNSVHIFYYKAPSATALANHQTTAQGKSQVCPDITARASDKGSHLTGNKGPRSTSKHMSNYHPKIKKSWEIIIHLKNTEPKKSEETYKTRKTLTNKIWTHILLITSSIISKLLKAITITINSNSNTVFVFTMLLYWDCKTMNEFARCHKTWNYSS